MKAIVAYLPIIVLAVLIFLSCKKEESCEGCINGNKPPIAIAGPDQVITLPTDSILVDGSASNDPDGTISEWLWKKISGPASFTIANAASAATIVRDIDTGVYRFELRVTDNGNLSATDTLQITVTDPGQPNRSPVANAGPDQTITLPTNTINLDGSASTDPDNNISNYLWTKITGPSSYTIANASAVQTQVTNLVEGVYQFELKVTDAGGLFSMDTLQVTVLSGNLPPCIAPNLPVIQASLTQIGTLSVPRMPIAATAGNKVVFAGGWSGVNCPGGPYILSGSSVVDIYDIQTQSWSVAQLSVARGGLRAVSCGNKIFFAGGENGTNAVYDNVDIYDVASNTWTTQHLSTPRAYVVTATIGTKVFFVGGAFYINSSNYPYGKSNVVDIYDISTNQWSATTLAGTPTGLYTATALNGKVYIAGGNYDGVVHIYDNNTNSWSSSNLQFQWQQPIMTGFNANPFTSFAVGDSIYWAGFVDEGAIYFPDEISGRAEVRNTISNSTSIKCFPVIFSQHPVFRNNDVAFFQSSVCLSNNGWGTLESFDIYHTTTGTWSFGSVNIPNFFTAHRDAGIVSANNTVYVGGGSKWVPSCIDFTDKVYILNW